MTDIGEATERYEEWLRREIVVVQDDLDTKHQLMAQDAFTFLRATYYRWTTLWPERCGPLADAPRVLAVGDLHTETFGTWRDADGRLAGASMTSTKRTRFPTPATSSASRRARSSPSNPIAWRSLLARSAMPSSRATELDWRAPGGRSCWPSGTFGSAISRAAS